MTSSREPLRSSGGAAPPGPGERGGAWPGGLPGSALGMYRIVGASPRASRTRVCWSSVGASEDGGERRDGTLGDGGEGALGDGGEGREGTLGDGGEGREGALGDGGEGGEGAFAWASGAEASGERGACCFMPGRSVPDVRPAFERGTKAAFERGTKAAFERGTKAARAGPRSPRPQRRRGERLDRGARGSAPGQAYSAETNATLPARSGTQRMPRSGSKPMSAAAANP
ncbi:hypothetical protein WMF31_31545 [Sorangium sp. So ce1036]|uniref:hypothetical protein n=1 Tax=Sorangium sp. So ce1036 TaxID=3133328 RepID=UPI003F0E325D